jgi:hypothetical protein
MFPLLFVIFLVFLLIPLLICFLICFRILVLSFIQVKAPVFNISMDWSGNINILYIFEVLRTLR